MNTTTTSTPVPTFDLPDSPYSLQLRPIPTAKKDREDGLRAFALCLWIDTENGYRYEIAALSGFVVHEQLVEDDGHPELFERARNMLMTTQDEWDAKNRDEQRTLQPIHAKWLDDQDMVASFEESIAALMSE